MIIIKLIQETLNKNQQNIADEIGVSRQTISMWLSGYNISNKHLVRINEVYGIPFYYLKKSQVSGVSFSNDDIEIIKKALLKESLENNNNLVERLFDLILNDNIIIKQVDKEDFKNLSSINIKLDKFSELMTLDKKNRYLFIIECYNKELLELIVFIENLKNKFSLDKVSYIIFKGKIDNVELITLGEQI